MGFAATADAGKIALQRGDLDFTKLRHSYSVGMTLRAGGFPMVFLMFAFGGGEGMHTTVNMNGWSGKTPLELKKADPVMLPNPPFMRIYLD